MGLSIILYIGEETGVQSGRYDGKYHMPKPLMWAWPVLGDLYVLSHLKWKWSRVLLFATPWTVAHQAPPSMQFTRQEYWSGLPFPSPGDLPNPGIEPRPPALQALPSEPPGKPLSHLILTTTCEMGLIILILGWAHWGTKELVSFAVSHKEAIPEPRSRSRQFDSRVCVVTTTLSHSWMA